MLFRSAGMETPAAYNVYVCIEKVKKKKTTLLYSISTGVSIYTMPNFKFWYMCRPVIRQGGGGGVIRYCSISSSPCDMVYYDPILELLV